MNARLNQDAPASSDFEVVLFYITHPSLSTPYRFSTDNADELSVDPYIRGTRSTWMGSNPATEGFVGILASAVLPDDKDDAPATGQIAIALSDQALVTAVRSVTTVPTMHIAVVMASSPNSVEFEVRDLDIVSAEINGDEILLTFSRENIELEPCPAGRFTKDSFPGLHK
ncbi:MAG: hypothetical protein KIT21_29135 [Shinella sp.]|nr:hypothetical protein [Shinella sp.]